MKLIKSSYIELENKSQVEIYKDYRQTMVVLGYIDAECRSWLVDLEGGIRRESPDIDYGINNHNMIYQELAPSYMTNGIIIRPKIGLFSRNDTINVRVFDEKEKLYTRRN